MSSAAAISQSGLTAATVRLTVSASNLVNARDSAPVGARAAYAPSQVAQSAAPGGGVTAKAVTVKSGQLIAADPASAASTTQVLVQMPEIDPISEVTNQLAASRAFAFSLEAFKAAQDEQQTLLDVTT